MKNNTEKDKVLVNSTPALKKWVVPEINDLSIFNTKATTGADSDGYSYGGTT